MHLNTIELSKGKAKAVWLRVMRWESNRATKPESDEEAEKEDEHVMHSDFKLRSQKNVLSAEYETRSALAATAAGLRLMHFETVHPIYLDSSNCSQLL